MAHQSFEDMLFDRFFADVGRGKTEATRRRYAHIMALLDFFLDQVDVAPHLGTDPAALLEIERDFGRRGAFFRVLDVTDFVCCLPEFLDPRWMSRQPGVARTQISLVGRLLAWLAHHQLIDMSVGRCAYWEAESAVRQARLARRQAAAAADNRGL